MPSRRKEVSASTPVVVADCTGGFQSLNKRLNLRSVCFLALLRVPTIPGRRPRHFCVTSCVLYLLPRDNMLRTLVCTLVRPAAAAAAGSIPLASTPNVTRKRTQKRQQLLRSAVAGGGTSLRSLCWLLLHRCSGVSEGAAAVLLALTSSRRNQLHLHHDNVCSGSDTSTVNDVNSNISNSSGRLDHNGTGDTAAAVFPWAVLSLIEQGCVPILRMAVGHPASADTPSFPPGFCGAEGGETSPLAAHAGRSAETVANQSTTIGAGPNGEQPNAHYSGESAGSFSLPSSRSCWPQDGNGDVSAVNKVGMPRAASRGSGGISRQAARESLKVVADGACARHSERLVHSVTLSGNRELRANVSLALVILCAGTEPRQGGQVRLFWSLLLLLLLLCIFHEAGNSSVQEGATRVPLKVRYQQLKSVFVDGVDQDVRELDAQYPPLSPAGET